MPQKKIRAFSNKKVGTMGEFLAWSIFKENGSNLSVDVGDNYKGRDPTKRNRNGDLLVDESEVEIKTSTYSSKGWRFSFACVGGADYLMLICLSINYGFRRYYLISRKDYLKLNLPFALYINEGGELEKRLKKYRDNLGDLTR